MFHAIDTNDTRFATLTAITPVALCGNINDGWSVGVAALGGEFILSNVFDFNGGAWSTTIALRTLSQNDVCTITVTREHEDVRVFGCYAGQLSEVADFSAELADAVMNMRREINSILTQAHCRAA